MWTHGEKWNSFLILLFLILIMQTTSEKWHFGIGSVLHTLHSLALLRSSDGNSVSDPESRISAFKEILGFWSSEQPDNPILFLLLFTWARLALGSHCSPPQRGGRPACFFFSQQWALQTPHTLPSLGCVRQRDAFGLATVLCVWELLCLEATFIAAVHCKGA